MTTPNEVEWRHEKLLESIGRLVQAATRDQALDVTIREIGPLLNAEGTSIWLVRDDPDRVVLAKSYEDLRVVVGESSYSRLLGIDGKYDGLTGYIFATGKSLQINNICDIAELDKISKELRWSDKFKGWESGGKEKVRPFLGVPIFSPLHEGVVIGVLRVATTRDRRPFHSLDRRWAELFARVLALALVSFDRQTRTLDLLTALCSRDPRGRVALSAPEVLDRAVTTFRNLFPGSHCSVLMTEPGDRSRYYFKASSAPHLKDSIDSGAARAVSYRAGDGKTGKIIESGSPFIAHGTPEAPLSSAKDRTFCEISEPATTFMGAPIVNVRSQETVGVIRSAKHARDVAERFTLEDLELLKSLAAELSFMTTFLDDNSLLQSKNALGITHAFLDPSEVVRVLETFSSPRRPSDGTTIMFVDISGFTRFCEEASGLRNDPVLIISFLNLFFEEMSQIVREHEGVINALKGDEFMALFNSFKPCQKHRLQALRCADRIRKAFFCEFQACFISHFRTVHGVEYVPEVFTNLDLGIKIGLNTSSNVVIGSLGPLDSQTITAIGQDVNTASRLITDVVKQQRVDKNSVVLGFHATCCNDEVAGLVQMKKPVFVEIRGMGGSLAKQAVYEIVGVRAERRRVKVRADRGKTPPKTLS